MAFGSMRTAGRWVVLTLSLTPATLVLGWTPTARATVPYPDYDVYQATAYERHAWECMARLGLQPECARLLESAIEFNPNRASSHHALAWYYLRAGDQGRALASFATALRLDPKLFDALRAMGDIYGTQGKHTLAEEKYQQYLQAAPQDPLAWYSLASLSALKGEKDRAVARLKDAVDHGFRDFALLEKDPRWSTLKADPRVTALKPAGG